MRVDEVLVETTTPDLVRLRLWVAATPTTDESKVYEWVEQSIIDHWAALGATGDPGYAVRRWTEVFAAAPINAVQATRANTWLPPQVSKIVYPDWP